MLRRTLLVAVVPAAMGAAPARHFDVTAAFAPPKNTTADGAVAVTFRALDPDVRVNETPAPRLKLDLAQAVLVDKQAPAPSQVPDYDPLTARYLDPAKPVLFAVAIAPTARRGAYDVKASVVYFYCSTREGWCRRGADLSRSPSPGGSRSVPFAASPARSRCRRGTSRNAPAARRAGHGTAARGETRVSGTPASVAVLPRPALEATASPAVDDALRQVPGFSLFRRTGSLTANPTAQGVSLRGLGAAGGRAGDRRFGQRPVRGLRTGGSCASRSKAEVPGAVHPISTGGRPRRRPVVTRSGGRAGPRAGERRRRATLDLSSTLRGARGPWAARLSAQAFRTDGYVPVDEWSRGAVDTKAASRHLAVDATVERRAFGEGRVFARGMAYGEDRENGTPLQVNDTRMAWERWASTGGPRNEVAERPVCGARPRSSTRPSAPWPRTAPVRI
jgi:hypothetical protein